MIIIPKVTRSIGFSSVELEIHNPTVSRTSAAKTNARIALFIA
jgi:hypothetical protein